MEDNNKLNLNTHLGPLAGLIGTWEGRQGHDVAPEPDGEELNDFYEVLTFKSLGEVENALSQELAVVHYEQIVKRQSDDKLIHHQCGYWTWDANDNSVANTFSIGRRVSVVAMGTVNHMGKKMVFSVDARAGQDICEAAFMAKNASTQAFSLEMILEGDSLSYQQTTLVDIYQRKAFQHTDKNQLIRVS